jgi:hypothetical protein
MPDRDDYRAARAYAEHVRRREHVAVYERSAVRSLLEWQASVSQRDVGDAEAAMYAHACALARALMKERGSE